MSSFLTYNNIIDILKDIATRHYQINTFYLGKDWDIENDGDIQYPVMQVYPTLAKMPRNAQGEFKTIQINMNIKVVDLTQQSQENERDIHSDTLQIAQDIINELNQHPYYQNSNVSIINDINLSNLEEYNDDFTAGWQFDLNLQLINNNTFCGIPSNPIDGITYNGPSVTGYTYTETIDCDTIANCPIIIDIDNRLTTVESIVFQQNQLISGSITYLSGLTFDITPLVYVIDGTIYNITNATQVTVTSGDTTYDRIDTIYADIYGNTGVIEGTPSDNPVKPSVNPNTQVEISFVSIPAGGSSPSITETLVFDEATPITEWGISTIDNPWVSLSTVQSYTGTKSIRFSASTTSKYVEFSAATVFDTSNQNTIQFAIKNTIAWPASNTLDINIVSTSGVILGSAIQLYNGQYGFSSTDTTNWQIISIPVASFNAPTTFIGGLRFTANVTAPDVFNTYIDLVKFVTGIPSANLNPIFKYFRVDDGTILTPITSTDTLILSGGTNINTTTNGTNTIYINLDDNISVNTISATTYYNLPLDVYVTGGTFNSTNGTTTLTRNDGANIDITGFQTAQLKETITVGENVNAGDLLYLSTDSKYYKVSNSLESKSSTELRLALTGITINNTGSALIKGQYTTSGLTAGEQYWLGNSGNYTTAQPTTNNSIVRYIGTALSSTVLEFNPDETYIEIYTITTPFITNPSVRIISTSQTALTTDSTIICISGLTLTLPTAIGVTGKMYNIKSKTDDIITINTTGGQTIDGEPSDEINIKNTNKTIQSDGSNWIII